MLAIFAVTMSDDDRDIDVESDVSKPHTYSSKCHMDQYWLDG